MAAAPIDDVILVVSDSRVERLVRRMPTGSTWRIVASPNWNETSPVIPLLLPVQPGVPLVLDVEVLHFKGR